jgi:hypothetical protein
LLDAQVSSELLISLFIPEGMNKLHDGSVVIRNYRIAKAGVFFPMPEGRVVDESFGSRHRAALGITEETDAVVVIVSEERGTISFCFNGNIASNLDGAKLRTMLEAIFSPKVRKKTRKAKSGAAETPVSRRELTEGPKSQRRPPGEEPEVVPQRISLVAEPGSPLPTRVRAASEPPPPLRNTLTPGPLNVAPLRTPVNIDEADDSRHSEPDGEPPEGGGSA